MPEAQIVPVKVEPIDSTRRVKMSTKKETAENESAKSRKMKNIDELEKKTSKSLTMRNREVKFSLLPEEHLMLHPLQLRRPFIVKVGFELCPLRHLLLLSFMNWMRTQQYFPGCRLLVYCGPAGTRVRTSKETDEERQEH